MAGRTDVRQTIEKLLCEALAESGSAHALPLPDDLVLLRAGLDSLQLAILITQLEHTLGYDPFTMMEDGTYPATLGELVAIYEGFDPRE